jgi:type III secretion protein R
MAASLDPQIVRGLYGTEQSASPEALKSDLGRLLPAYTLSQLKSALVLGVMLLIPFVLLDLVVVHVLSLLGIQQIGAQVVSLPLKLILFLAIDGWGLLGAKLLAGGA